MHLIINYFHVYLQVKKMDGFNASSIINNVSTNVTDVNRSLAPAEILLIYILPIIIFVGLFGNVVSFVVFLDKELRHISSSVYIMAVLCSDTGMLLNQTLVWLEALRISPWFGQGMCKLFVFSGFVFAFLSEWYVVCITVENYVTLRHPTKITTLCTIRRAVIVTVSLATLAVSSYFIYLFTTGTDLGYCNNNMSSKLEQIYFYVDNIATLLLPTIVVFVLLAAIVLQVIKSIKSKRRMSLSKTKKKKSSIPQVRVAKMLFVLSISAFVLSTPDHVVKLYFSMSGLVFLKLSELQKLTFLVFMFLYYTRFSTKFFILIAFSKNFRKKLLSKIRCDKNMYDMVQSKDSLSVHHVATNTSPTS